MRTWMQRRRTPGHKGRMRMVQSKMVPSPAAPPQATAAVSLIRAKTVVLAQAAKGVPLLPDPQKQ